MGRQIKPPKSTNKALEYRRKELEMFKDFLKINNYLEEVNRCVGGYGHFCNRVMSKFSAKTSLTNILFCTRKVLEACSNSTYLDIMEWGRIMGYEKIRWGTIYYRTRTNIQDILTNLDIPISTILNLTYGPGKLQKYQRLKEQYPEIVKYPRILRYAKRYNHVY